MKEPPFPNHSEQEVCPTGLTLITSSVSVSRHQMYSNFKIAEDRKELILVMNLP
jgi:hypothetical protein